MEDDLLLAEVMSRQSAVLGTHPLMKKMEEESGGGEGIGKGKGGKGGRRVSDRFSSF